MFNYISIFIQINRYIFKEESTCNAGDMGSIPESARSPGEGNGNPLQYSCLENSMDRGASWATDHRVVKSQIQLRDFHSLTHRLEMCSIGTC